MNATNGKTNKGKTLVFKKASDFGSIWKPTKKGETKTFEVQGRHWQTDKDDMFPVTLAADVETGEVYSLRTDLTFLRIVEKVPVTGIIRLTYAGLGEKKGKRNAARMFQFEYADCELSDTSLMPEPPTIGRHTKPKSKGRK